LETAHIWTKYSTWMAGQDRPTPWNLWQNCSCSCWKQRLC